MNGKTLAIPFQPVQIFLHKKVLRCRKTESGKANRCKAVLPEKIVFERTIAIKIIMQYFSQFSFFLFAGFNKEVDAHSLLNIEDVFVGRTIRASLLFLLVTVEIKNVDSVKG